MAPAFFFNILHGETKSHFLLVFIVSVVVVILGLLWLLCWKVSLAAIVHSAFVDLVVVRLLQMTIIVVVVVIVALLLLLSVRLVDGDACAIASSQT
jgi:hypothetical protein